MCQWPSSRHRRRQAISTVPVSRAAATFRSQRSWRRFSPRWGKPSKKCSRRDGLRSRNLPGAGDCMDDKGHRGTTQDGFRVVCLCGSAGALEAYRKILRALPADTGMAFVIATHRGMEHAELLPRLLAEVTGMPVTEIQEGLRLEPNRIFLMPPHMHMTMAGPVLHLQPRAGPAAGPYRSTPFYVPLPRRSDRSRLPSFSPAWETTGARV